MNQICIIITETPQQFKALTSNKIFSDQRSQPKQARLTNTLMSCKIYCKRVPKYIKMYNLNFLSELKIQ